MRVLFAVAALVGGCDLVYSLDRPDTTGWVALSVGNSHVCGLTRDGALYCWGSNTSGEVGLGDELSTIDAPTQLIGAQKWTSVSTKFLHTCALQDGAASCWGYNVNGQLGTNSTTTTRIPKPIDGEWTYLDPSYVTTCAIDAEAQLWCWGNNAYAQLGDNTMTSRLVPTKIGAARWQSVASGGLHTCGIQEDGSLWCWGDDNGGTVADPALATRSTTPILLGDDRWRAIASGFTHTCGITVSGTLRCWGSNAYAQLGIGDGMRADEPTPVLVDGTDHDDWTQLAAGPVATCAMRDNGKVYCWGNNERGLVDGTEYLIRTPREIEPPPGATWTQVSLGSWTACFVDDRNRAFCRGVNSFSQFGDGGTSHRVPASPAPDSPADSVSVGDHVTCAISGTELRCGGKGNAYQLGNNTFTARGTLGAIEGAWSAVSVGYEHACGIRTDSSAACWGTDRNENLGNGAGALAAGMPGAVTPARTFMTLDAGAYFTCGIDTTRSIYCWGDNTNGQLGNNSAFGVSGTAVGVIASQVTQWNAVSAGASHACGITSTGLVRCWGDNSFGQLGDNTNVEKRAATGMLVSGDGALPAFSKISAGVDHTCAIGADNVLWCWGNNVRGQLGYDSGFFSAVPVAKKVPGSWTDVAAGNQFTCGVRGDQTLWCWGANSRGQLGDGTLIDRREPTQVEGAGWTGVVAGTDHACGLRGTTMACWGSNDEGATVTGDAWTSELREIVAPPR